MLSRRDLLALSGASLATLGLPENTFAQGSKKKRVKNIIFCVSDGMAASIPTMADHLQQIRDGKEGYWRWLTKQDYAVNGWQDTRSLNSVVTDSSAAASSWGCGRHIWNGMTNTYPDGTKLATLTQILSRTGVKCGLVTTATITHATPSGFAVNSMSRDWEDVIAVEYLNNSGVDILMGGGDRFFSPTLRKDKRDLYADFAKAGFNVVKDRNAMLGLKANKILGIYSNSHLPYTLDQINDPKLIAAVPTLAEMAKVAIDNLKGSKEGFLLQIEGAKIDHGAHGNDIGAALYDQIAFEQAVKVAIDFALADGETLVVITADHSTGGPALNGDGDEYIDSTAGLKTLLNMKSTYGGFLGTISINPTVERTQSSVEEKLGIKLSKDEAQTFVNAAQKKYDLGANKFMRSLNGTLATVLGNHTRIGWTSGNHTSDFVMVTAVGPGKEHFAGVTQNISMFDIILGLKGLKWSNPTMSFEDARKYREKNAMVGTRDEFA